MQTKAALGMKKGCFLFCYLGVMIADQRLVVKYQSYIMDKAKAKLSGWKGDSLSQARWLVLIQSIL